MKALFLGNVAADTYAGIKDELPPGLDSVVLPDPQQIIGAPEAAAEADILISNHWRAEYPPAPKLRLVQSVATGIELFDLAALPRGAAVCNSFGHETAIAEYVVMVWLALHHRLPMMYGGAPIVQEGLLMSHGTDFLESARVQASYINRILHGAKPFELPVQYSTNYQLVVAQSGKRS